MNERRHTPFNEMPKSAQVLVIILLGIVVAIPLALVVLLWKLVLAL